jgi:hypothetical protein
MWTAAGSSYYRYCNTGSHENNAAAASQELGNGISNTKRTMKGCANSHEIPPFQTVTASQSDSCSTAPFVVLLALNLSSLTVSHRSNTVLTSYIVARLFLLLIDGDIYVVNVHAFESQATRRVFQLWHKLVNLSFSSSSESVDHTDLSSTSSLAMYLILDSNRVVAAASSVVVTTTGARPNRHKVRPRASVR